MVIVLLGYESHVACAAYELDIREFLRSLQVFDDSEIDFNGDFEDFNDLLLDIAEEAEGMEFDVRKEADGEYSRITIE